MMKITGAKVVIETLIQEKVEIILVIQEEQFFQFTTKYLNKRKSDIF